MTEIERQLNIYPLLGMGAIKQAEAIEQYERIERFHSPNCPNHPISAVRQDICLIVFD